MSPEEEIYYSTKSSLKGKEREEFLDWFKCYPLRLNVKRKFNTAQILVLEMIMSHTNISGRKLREELRRLRIRISGPRFYAMMAKLEETGVISHYETCSTIDGEPIKEWKYKINLLQLAWTQ